MLHAQQPVTTKQTTDTISKSKTDVKKAFPVIGKKNDTLFYVYTKIGAFTAKDRATYISDKIQGLDTNFFISDSLKTDTLANEIDLMYKGDVLVSISNQEATAQATTKEILALQFTQAIIKNLDYAGHALMPKSLILKIGLILLILVGVWLVLKLVGFIYKKMKWFIHQKKDKWFKSLSYNNYTFITPEQELKMALFLVEIIKWLLILIVVYVFFPLIFSVFEFTRGWSNYLFDLIFSSFGGIFKAIWNYLPNIIKIAAIIIVMKYFMRFVKYIFSEIQAEKLQISGFHADWAMPTFTIVRFLLYAFMFVLIFPLLPGSDSTIFKGVSVFIGILFSLGSSSAIANMVAGLVITYMRPFKIGDRVNLGNVSGNVIEKTMLVTRIKTIKNEEITIPNSSVLTGNTTNYSTYAQQDGLIINTSVTLGYDIPYKKVYQALIEAALRTDMIEKTPQPFVLQTSLEDFYVSYQLNAYTKQANKQAVIYSQLHQNIQDCCNELDIEILSPHYRAQRDGNMTTIPQEYLKDDYKSPGFNINIQKDKKED
ncbi:mechanosensitive ion channel family protein [Zhouia sp. PK063]|uniref:mechanosensitive ion channel family protein n=1 Tax=Zhouia sp. PK063 TaxID=3373602 RepID=UPI00379FA488